MRATDWLERAVCADGDPDELFVRGPAQNRAKLICRSCPVRDECLAEALDNRIERGVWGGMTERERRDLLRRRPNVASWRSLIRAGRGSRGSPMSVVPRCFCTGFVRAGTELFARTDSARERDSGPRADTGYRRRRTQGWLT